MDRKISSSFVFLFVFSYSWPVHFVSSLTKCCPPQYELSSSENVAQIVSRSSVVCVKSTDSVLTVSRPAVNLTIGLPDCGALKFVDVRDKLTRVDCVDRVAQRNTIFGVRCENDFGPAPQRFTIPSVANFRKCCPPNRKYDARKQFCGHRSAENESDALSDVLRLSTKSKGNTFVNVTYGPPRCRRTHALFDRLEYYKKIRLTQSEGIYDSSGALSLSFDEYCLDVVDDLLEYLVIRSCRDERTICAPTSTICVRKCCPIGYEVKRKGCQPSTEPFSVAVHNGTLALADVRPAILQGDKCSGGKYKVDENASEYVLQLDGRIHKLSTNKVIGVDEYCFDAADKEKGTHLFICFPDKWQVQEFKLDFRITVNIICAGTSAFFLLLTFIIYAILPSLQNAHCRLIMCYLFTFMIAYVLVVLQGVLPRIGDVPPTPCKILGYAMLFSFLSSFSWLNIISFDIWSTLRAVESPFLKKSKTGKRFFLFCLYGWGFAAGWTMLAVFCQSTTAEMPAILKPDIGQLSCWFTNFGTSRIPFFIVPFSIMITFNVVLFILTVKYCAQIKSELKMSHSHNSNYSIQKYTADMKEFMINIKLFILMGLNWSMELISLIVEPENRICFLISDIVNGSVGLIIFCLFVLKRRVLQDLKTTFFGKYSVPRPCNRAATSMTSASSSLLQRMINSGGIETTS